MGLSPRWCRFPAPLTPLIGSAQIHALMFVVFFSVLINRRAVESVAAFYGSCRLPNNARMLARLQPDLILLSDTVRELLWTDD